MNKPKQLVAGKHARSAPQQALVITALFAWTFLWSGLQLFSPLANVFGYTHVTISDPEFYLLFSIAIAPIAGGSFYLSFLIARSSGQPTGSPFVQVINGITLTLAFGVILYLSYFLFGFIFQ